MQLLKKQKQKQKNNLQLLQSCIVFACFNEDTTNCKKY